MGVHNEESRAPSSRRPLNRATQTLYLSSTPSSTSGDVPPASTSSTGGTPSLAPVTPVVERKLRPRPTLRAPVFSQKKRSLPDELAEKPTPRGASKKWKKQSAEGGFHPIHDIDGCGSAPALAAVELENEGEDLKLEKDTKAEVELETKRKRKMGATVEEGERIRVRQSRVASGVVGENKCEDEAVAQKGTCAGTLGRKRAETKRLQDTALLVAGEEMHSQIDGLTEKIEGIIKLEPKDTRDQSMPPVTVGGKSSRLRPLMQKQDTEKLESPITEDEGWSVQSDLGTETEREIENIKDELRRRKGKELEEDLSGGNLLEQIQNDENTLSWREYPMDSILAGRNFQIKVTTDDHASSPFPSPYAHVRRDSGVSFGGHFVDPQPFIPTTHPVLLLRGGEASTVLVTPTSYPSEQLQFGLSEDEEKRLYQMYGEEYERSRLELGGSANQAVEGLYDNVFGGTQGRGKGQQNTGNAQLVELETMAQVNIEYGVVDPNLEEAEYPVLHFTVPSPFGDGARDEWYGGIEGEDANWDSPDSNETVEISEPGSGKTGEMVWDGGEWPGWDEMDSPVWIEQDWGKWTEGIRGPYGQGGL